MSKLSIDWGTDVDEDVDVDRVRLESSNKDEGEDGTVDSSANPAVVVSGIVTTTADEAYQNIELRLDDVGVPPAGNLRCDRMLDLALIADGYDDASVDRDRTIETDDDAAGSNSAGTELSVWRMPPNRAKIRGDRAMV